MCGGGGDTHSLILIRNAFVVQFEEHCSPHVIHSGFTLCSHDNKSDRGREKSEIRVVPPSTRDGNCGILRREYNKGFVSVRREMHLHGVELGEGSIGEDKHVEPRFR